MTSTHRGLRPSTSRWRGALALLALVAGLAACSDDDTDTAEDAGASTTPAVAEDADTDAADTTTSTTTDDERPWPADDWPRTSADAAGMDASELQALAADAEINESNCLVVTRDGELVEEWYWNDTNVESEHESFSTTKSVTATLVGIAQDQGALDIDQPASDFITEWQGTPSESVTVRNLLSNDSGRFHDNETDYGAMAVEAEDKTAFSIELGQQHEPGAEWVYNNAAIQTLEAVLERATGQSVVEFADEHLFEPLGMDSDMTTDPAGNALVFMGMQTTCRDLARFGLLYLRGGEWDGEQVISEPFVAEATSPSTDLNPGYGHLWWLLGEEDAETAPGQGPISADDPHGYAALGLGDQVLAVFPDTGVVVTRLGAAGNEFNVADIAAWAAGVEETEE